MPSAISKALLTKKCTGVAKFENGLKTKASFTVVMRYDAQIIGNIVFQTKQKVKLLKCLDLHFQLNGSTKDDQRKIVAKKCMITNRRETFGNGWVIRCRFTARRVALSPEDKRKKPTKDILVRFGLVNFHETMGLDMQTRLGHLMIRHFGPTKVFNKAMKQGNKALSADASIFIKTNGSQTIQDIVEESKDLMNDFLKVTSLAQTVWHNYAFIQVSEKVDNTQHDYVEVFLELYQAKVGDPSGANWITNMADCDYFLRSAWKDNLNFKDLDDKYGFSIGLEWYVASNNGKALLESKFQSLMTALEHLMDKHHEYFESDMILTKTIFNQLSERLEDEIADELNKKAILLELQNLVIQKLPELNRRTFSWKLDQLLHFWRIKHSDLDVTLDQIKTVRNNITHKGIYAAKSKQEEKLVLRAYIGAFTLLTRVFLAMIQFSGKYFDPTKRARIDFKRVRTKIKTT